MWFWETIERRLNSGVSLERAGEIIRRAGFERRGESSTYAIYRKTGNRWTLSGKDASLELGVARSNDGLYLLLRYASPLVIRDSGELVRFADELAAQLRSTGE